MIAQLAEHQVVEDVDGIKIIRLADRSDLIIGVDFTSSGLGPVYQLGQLVRANGCYAAPRGTLGIITKIHRPYVEGRTSNILKVHFEGFRYTEFMKTKDLE